MLDFLGDPGLLIPYALIQAVVILLLIRFLDIYEREPMAVVGMMALWGGTFAPALVLAARRRMLEVLPNDDPVQSAISAAFVEEPVKGVALLAAFALSYVFARRFGWLEFEGVTDGVVYGAAVGLGFAFTEDVFYLVQQADISSGLEVFLQRADFLGLTMVQHAVYTGTFGAGLGLATWERSWFTRIAYGALGLALAVTMHAAHNGMAAAGLALPARGSDFIFVLAFLAAMLGWLRRQRRVLRDELEAEKETGLIDEADVDEVSSFWRGVQSRWRLTREGKIDELRVRRVLHNELVELAFARWRLKKVGLRAAWEPLEMRRRRVRALKAEL